MKGHAEQCEHLEKRLCCALLLVFIALAMKHGKFEPERGKIKSESATRADGTHSCITPQAKLICEELTNLGFVFAQATHCK